MLNQTRLAKNCGLHLLRIATRNFLLILENNIKFKMQLIAIKNLACKALERNSSDTFPAKLWINHATFPPKNPLQKLRSEKPYFGLEIDQLNTLAADDWDEVKDNPSMPKTMVETYIMLKGLDPEMPSTVYIKTVHCQHCGEIKTWSNCPYDKVSCCQWCLVNNDLIWNR
jgi:hypothetical protein